MAASATPVGTSQLFPQKFSYGFTAVAQVARSCPHQDEEPVRLPPAGMSQPTGGASLSDLIASRSWAPGRMRRHPSRWPGPAELLATQTRRDDRERARPEPVRSVLRRAAVHRGDPGPATHVDSYAPNFSGRSGPPRTTNCALDAKSVARNSVRVSVRFQVVRPVVPIPRSRHC
jgi:hypothetical protein